MRGFFTEKEVPKVVGGKGHSCVSCGLHKNSNHPKMKPTGGFKKGILNIGDFPSEKDDKNSSHWSGGTGEFLRREYHKLGIDLHEDCLNVNSVNCVPANSKPTTFQLACCNTVVISKLIQEHQPRIIVVFGQTATYSVIGMRWKKDFGLFSKWEGFVIPDQEYKCWIAPIENPRYIAGKDTIKQRQFFTVWRQQLQRVVNHINKDFPRYKKPQVRFIDDLTVLDGIKSGSVVIDYETTGLKPQAPGHRIVCASVAYSADHCYSFMIPPTRAGRRPFLELLMREGVGKIAQNMRFEDLWTTIRLKTTIRNWEWDTMLASHQLDNRPGITGLKFQTYIRFGILDYDSEVNPYLKATEEGSNNINRIMELIDKPGGKEKLLTYCGYDTIHTYRLAQLQIEALNYKFLPF